MMATEKKKKKKTGDRAQGRVSEWQLCPTQGAFVLPFGKAEQFSSLTLTAEVG